jgi:hypothetical protein
VWRHVHVVQSLTQFDTNRHSRRKKRPAAQAGRTIRLRPQPVSLQFLNVGSLRSTLTFDDVEFDSLAFLQSTEPVTQNGGVVNEYVAATLHLDEPITLLSIEPLYCSLHA